MGMILEVFFDRMTVFAEHLDIISRMGRKVIITGNQIRQLARRGRNRFGSMRNRPVRLEEEPTFPTESFKRLYSGQLAEEKRRLAMYLEAGNAQADSDLYHDCNDGLSGNGPVSAINSGNLYGGNGITGTTNNMNTGTSNHMKTGTSCNGHGNIGDTGGSRGSPDGSTEGLDPAVILANQGWEVYGENWEVYGENRNIETRGRRLRGNGKNSGARRLLTIGNISVVDSSDSD